MLPETNEKIANVNTIIAEIPAANPSTPSVRFAPFDTAVIINTTMGIKINHVYFEFTPIHFIKTNIVGTYNLLEGARCYWNALGEVEKTRFRFHHVSTDEVFGSCNFGQLFTEETPYKPNSPYSASKAASDHLVRAWNVTYGLPTLITNCSNNYGPFQFPEKLMASVFEIDSLGESMNSSVFSSDRFEYGVKLLETRKNNFTAVANVDTYNNGENDISFLQFNNEDATIKPNSILETGNQIPKDFEVTSDGGLFVIGEVLSTKYAGIDLFIHRYDRNQNRSWGNEFGGFGNDIGLDAVLSKDGGMITVGSTDSFGRGGTDGWLVKVDGDGNIVWTVSYGGKSLDQFSSISKTKSGDYILSGSTLSQSSNEDMWVMKIDENGDDIWGKTYGGIDDDYAVSIKEIPSGEFILVGQTRSSIRDNGLNILVSKLNSTGEKLWSSEINGKSDKIANSFSLLNDEKDGFIIIGQLRMKGGQSKILMIKMNQRGKIIWERTYGGNYISEGSSVLDDGTGLVVMGNHDIDSNGNSEIIFFKTDYDGKIMND